jgi:hypothetical protein
MYWIASAIMVITAITIALKLPEVLPNFKGSYKELMRSVWNFAKKQPVLQLAAFRGAMGFGAFSAFFTTLVFHLEAPPFLMARQLLEPLVSSVPVGRLPLLLSIN